MGVGILRKIGNAVTAISKGHLNTIIDAANGDVIPRSSEGQPNNGQQDIGSLNNRFRNVYISGRVFQPESGDINIDGRNTVDGARMVSDGTIISTRFQTNYLIPQGAGGEVIVYASESDPLTVTINGNSTSITESITVETIPWVGDVYRMSIVAYKQGFDNFKNPFHPSPCRGGRGGDSLLKNGEQVTFNKGGVRVATDIWLRGESRGGDFYAPQISDINTIEETTQRTTGSRRDLHSFIHWKQFCIDFDTVNHFWAKGGASATSVSYASNDRLNNPPNEDGRIWSTPNINALFIRLNGDVFAYANELFRVEDPLDFPESDDARNGDIALGLYDLNWYQYNSLNEEWAILEVALLGLVIVEPDGSANYSAAVIPQSRVDLINYLRANYKPFTLANLLEQTSDVLENDE